MTTTLTEPRRVLVGYMHPSDFADVRDGGWINTSLSREPVPFSVPVYADEPIAILRAQADALASPPPAEPGELPPLPGPVVNWPKNIAMADGGEVLAATYYSADQMNAHARHALATSPLPAERVERVMFAVNEALDMQGRFTIGKASGADVRNSLAAVRAILEGRS